MKRLAFLCLCMSIPALATAEEPPAEAARQPGELVVGVGPGWRPLKEADFAHVNDEADTWTFADDKAEIRCKGTPVGVIRTKDAVKNFELVVEWRHLRSGGNSGVFVWAPPKALADLKPGHLPPGGIEVQILDHGYAEQYKLSTGKTADWFTTHGDVFPVGSSTMKPFPPLSPDGSRSFPTKHRSWGLNQWNHYYVRGVNGEIRLWVNGEEVSGGAQCQPAEGHLCLEAEGSPLEFRNLRIRELP
ncbi:3-keto-disaccharide hydrolase [Paludisphaera mucosa]|uniref:DUF1080 domain-containing protein n=1 Tax=Paludisphaera mucosa TaxID=3030827 RepID=A0ABT6FKA3_9BACT|nr:DUF1080 domain-containing protein [Paludisphaera mucosa]MDG3007982.1 DUF1080 domain-containing protein [Paludisphaera mucosa]